MYAANLDRYGQPQATPRAGSSPCPPAQSARRPALTSPPVCMRRTSLWTK